MKPGEFCKSFYPGKCICILHDRFVFFYQAFLPDRINRMAYLKNLFRTKSLDRILTDSSRPEYQLRRALGPFQLTLLGIGAIIGAGIFATIGTAAAGDVYRPGAGPALMVSFIITAVVCGFTALCYAEFASLVPISGSAYTYSYATLGEIVAWIIGWDLIIEYAVGNIAVAISWANYFKTFLAGFGIAVPDWLSMDYRTAAGIVDSAGVQVVFRGAPHVFGMPVVFNLLAVGIVALITVILILGIRESARFNAVMVGIKIAVLLFFIAVGAAWVKPANWTPFAPNGWAGISAGAAIVFFAYIGFDAVSTVAEETRNPSRNVPIGIIASLAVCTVFYVVVSAVFTGLISLPELRATLATEKAEPLTVALQHASSTLGWAVGIVAFGSVIAHTAVLLIFQLGQPRIFFSMARDGLMPRAFTKVHPRFRTPYVSTIVTGAFVAGFAAVANIDEMVDLTNIGTLFAFILVCAGIIILRKRDPGRPRPFRVPGGLKWAAGLYAAAAAGIAFIPVPVIVKVLAWISTAAVFYLGRNILFPMLGMLSCAYLIVYLPPTSWLRFAAWLNIGFVIYSGYGILHSRMQAGDENQERSDRLAYSAEVGAILAWTGTGLLVITHAFDVFIEALKTNADLHGWLLASNSLSAVFQADAWNRIFWFLDVPLAVNAFILCPMVLARSRAAAGRTKKAKTARAAALALGILITVYFFYVCY
jgi:basic amino acid/polyamine antiporter, APA family